MSWPRSAPAFRKPAACTCRRDAPSETSRACWLGWSDWLVNAAAAAALALVFADFASMAAPQLAPHEPTLAGAVLLSALWPQLDWRPRRRRHSDRRHSAQIYAPGDARHWPVRVCSTSRQPSRIGARRHVDSPRSRRRVPACLRRFQRLAVAHLLRGGRRKLRTEHSARDGTIDCDGHACVSRDQRGTSARHPNGGASDL